MIREGFHSVAWPIALDRSLGTLADEQDYPRHVDQLIRQVLLTNPGERVHRPDFGCGVRRMVFAPNNPAGASLVELAVREALGRWLASAITVDSVAVSASNETMAIEIQYVLLARQERRYLNVEVAL